MSDSVPAAAPSRGTGRPAVGDNAGVFRRFFRFFRTLIPRIVTFIRQVVAELRKVIWPTRQELITYTSVVLVFVVIMVTVVAIFDFAFTQGVLAVFGK